MKVLLDTNAIIYAVKNKIDIKQAVKQLDIPKPEIIVPEPVLQELRELAEKSTKGADKAAAKMALQIIKFSRFKVEIIGKGHTDDLIIDWAEKNHAAVTTNDAIFKKRLKAKGVPVFSIRQRKYLA